MLARIDKRRRRRQQRHKAAYVGNFFESRRTREAAHLIKRLLISTCQKSGGRQEGHMSIVLTISCFEIEKKKRAKTGHMGEDERILKRGRGRRNMSVGSLCFGKRQIDVVFDDEEKDERVEGGGYIQPPTPNLQLHSQQNIHISNNPSFKMLHCAISTPHILLQFYPQLIFPPPPPPPHQHLPSPSLSTCTTTSMPLSFKN